MGDIFVICFCRVVVNWWCFEFTDKCKGWLENSGSCVASILLPWGSMGIFQGVECIWGGSTFVVEWERLSYPILCSILIWYTVVRRPIEAHYQAEVSLFMLHLLILIDL